MWTKGLQEGGSEGTSYPGPGLGGPGLRGPGRVEVAAFSFGPIFGFFFPNLILGKKTGPNLSVDLFFYSSAKFGQKIEPNLSEDLFFCSLPKFGQKTGPNLSEHIFFYLLFFFFSDFGGPASIFGPPEKISL